MYNYEKEVYMNEQIEQNEPSNMNPLVRMILDDINSSGNAICTFGERPYDMQDLWSIDKLIVSRTQFYVRDNLEESVYEMYGNWRTAITNDEKELLADAVSKKLGDSYRFTYNKDEDLDSSVTKAIKDRLVKSEPMFSIQEVHALNQMHLLRKSLPEKLLEPSIKRPKM